jgi:transcriptional regulator with XRE-family HTH domain
MTLALATDSARGYGSLVDGASTGKVPQQRKSWSEPHSANLERDSADEASPVLGEILKRARVHRGLTLRQVQQQIGLRNAHLSQIERGQILRPDVAILMELAELYDLNYTLLAEWAGYLGPGARRTSSALVGMALRLFVELDPVGQSTALEYMEQLRNHAGTRQNEEGSTSEGAPA